MFKNIIKYDIVRVNITNWSPTQRLKIKIIIREQPIMPHAKSNNKLTKKKKKKDVGSLNLTVYNTGFTPLKIN